jgi:predicted alpha/beta-fold hydrolase
LGKEIFSRALGSNFTKVVKKNYEGLTMDPNHIATMAANDTIALKKPTLDEFDQTFTCRAGGPMPPFPFEKVDDYYRWASSHNVLHDIRVPFLAINADDDPFVQDVPRDPGENGYVVLEMTAGGGHLGWFQFGKRWAIEKWTTRPVLEWFKLTGDDMIHGANKASDIFQDSDGYLKERSRTDLGCKELRDGGLIDWTTVEMGTLQGL